MGYQTFFGTRAAALIAAIYVPKPVTFDDLWPRLRFVTLPSGRENRTRDVKHDDYAQMFLRGVKSYLMGTGHPDHPSLHEITGVTAAQVEAERHNRTLRPRLLLFAVMNRPQPPADEAWRITVSTRRCHPHPLLLKYH